MDRAESAAGGRRQDPGHASPPLSSYVATHTMEGAAIVPGCGWGHEVRLLAAKGLEVVGVDSSPEMVSAARAIQPVAAESYACVDWMHLPVSYGSRFEWVVEHAFMRTLQGRALGDFTDAVEFVLRPGGFFLGVFETVTSERDGPPFALGTSALDELFARFALLARWKPSEGFPALQGREEMRLYRKK